MPKPKPYTSYVRFLGLIVFFAGLVGLGLSLWELAASRGGAILSDDTALYMEWEGDLPALSQPVFGIDSTWVPEGDFRSHFVGVFAPDQWIVGHKFASKKEAVTFSHTFLAPGEKFTYKEIETTKYGIPRTNEIWSPNFSSSIAFAFVDAHLLMAPASSVLENEVFGDKPALQTNDRYQQASAYWDKNAPVKFYAHNEKSIKNLELTKNVALKSLFLAASKWIPASSLFVENEKKFIRVRQMMVTTDGFFADIKIPQDQVVPEIAQMVPQGVLFFVNSYDAWSQYQHTVEFLNRFDDRLATLFQGAIRGIVRSYLGPEMDFEKNFLQKMNGQYGLIWDVTGDDTPRLNFTLITGFGTGDAEADIEHLHQIATELLARYSIKIETVQLSGGREREEIVKAPQEETSIIKHEVDGTTFFTAQNPFSMKTFSYGFYEGKLIFSTNLEAFTSVIKTLNAPELSLAENEDFKSAILYKFSPSESYGFANIQKLKSIAEIVGFEDDLVPENIRNVVFSRKIFKNRVYWDFIGYWRQKND